MVQAAGAAVSRKRRTRPAPGSGKSDNLSGSTVEARRPLARWKAIVLVGIALVVVVWRLLRWGFAGSLSATTLPPPREAAPRATTERVDFVGAEACAGCHAAAYATWQRSTHGRAGGAPSRDLVIAAFNGTPMRFANAVVTPRVRGASYEFVVARAGEEPRTFRVDGVIGGGHMAGGGTQGFVTALPDGTMRFLPFDWSREGSGWFCNTNSRSAKGWVPITPELRLEECGDWTPVRVLGDLARYANCQSCHASQLTVALDSATHRWSTRLASLAINCESCHGPGRRHVQLMSSTARTAGADIGYAPLATLGKDASLRVCYQCHAVKDQLREGFLSGDSLEAHYSLKFPLLGDRPLDADGRVRTFAYQEAHQFSDCYLNGGMTCTSCHDPHSQQYRDVTGSALTGRFDDRQCTGCHQSKVGRVAEHSHHAESSAGSRCTACHMPYAQEPETRAARDVARSTAAPIRYARSDHSIAIPRPAADSALGVRGACAGCHATKPTAELERQLRAWWGELKPVKPVVAAQLRFTPQLSLAAAAPLLLGSAGDTVGDHHVFARFAGIARLLERYGKPDDDGFDSTALRRLTELTKHADEDVRAIALATLHLARGTDPGVRRTLSAALGRAGARDAGLRARWALALGFMGDRFVGAGDLPSAITSYARALEVVPANARVMLNLANAQRDAGDGAAAIASYRRTIALDARQPMAWVNLGIALGTAGDTSAAIDALTRAGELDSGEPLVWFNLANIHLVRGELDRAGELYAKAAALDPSMAVTHFRLARVWLLRKDVPEALHELRRGLAFDSSDTAARQAATSLARTAMGRGR